MIVSNTNTTVNIATNTSAPTPALTIIHTKLAHLLPFLSSPLAFLPLSILILFLAVHIFSPTPTPTQDYTSFVLQTSPYSYLSSTLSTSLQPSSHKTHYSYLQNLDLRYVRPLIHQYATGTQRKHGTGAQRLLTELKGLECTYTLFSYDKITYTLVLPGAGSLDTTSLDTTSLDITSLDTTSTLDSLTQLCQDITTIWHTKINNYSYLNTAQNITVELVVSSADNPDQVLFNLKGYPEVDESVKVLVDGQASIKYTVDTIILEGNNDNNTWGFISD